jgi:hypothetical protein
MKKLGAVHDIFNAKSSIVEALYIPFLVSFIWRNTSGV